MTTQREGKAPLLLRLIRSWRLGDGLDALKAMPLLCVSHFFMNENQTLLVIFLRKKKIHWLVAVCSQWVPLLALQRHIYRSMWSSVAYSTIRCSRFVLLIWAFWSLISLSMMKQPGFVPGASVSAILSKLLACLTLAQSAFWYLCPDAPVYGVIEKNLSLPTYPRSTSRGTVTFFSSSNSLY